MIQLDFKCPNHTGEAARVLDLLQGINIAGHEFLVERRHLLPDIGHLAILVRDEHAHKAKVALQNNRSLWGLRELYWVKIRIKDEQGTLVEILKKLARENINLEYSKSLYPEAGPMSETQVVFLVLNCTLASYTFAKAILREYIVDEDPSVPGSILGLISHASFMA